MLFRHPSFSETAFLFKDPSCLGTVPCSGTIFLFSHFVQHSLPVQTIFFRHSLPVQSFCSGTAFLSCVQIVILFRQQTTCSVILFRYTLPIQTSILFRQTPCSGKTLLFRHNPPVQVSLPVQRQLSFSSSLLFGDSLPVQAALLFKQHSITGRAPL